jgi:hypothetical protein
MKSFTYVAFALAVSLAAVAEPANAVIITFASFSDPTAVDNFRLVNTGNSTSPSRTTDAVLYSTTTGTSSSPGAALVRFSFLQPNINPFVNNVNARFNYNATIARGTPAVSLFGSLYQPGISGSFSFLSTSSITVTGPNFITHTYAAGSNLLSGTFTNSALFGGGTSASTSSSTQAGNVVVFTSDFLDFTNTVDRDGGLTLTAISPSLSKHTGLNTALNSFRAVAGGQFSSDPAPLINGAVPEPGTWMLMLMGFGLVGVSLRGRVKAIAT